MNIVFKDDALRLVTAPVLVPDRPDCDRCRGEEPLTAEKIQRMAFEYMATHRIVDQFHDYHVTKNNVAYPVASWILEDPKVYKNIRGDLVELPAGTWMATVKVANDETWGMVERGELQGFSVTALSKGVADQLASAKERVLIKDLDDPVGYTISLVPEPCVYEAVFCSVKEDIKIEAKGHAEGTRPVEIITEKDNPVRKAGRMISDRTLNKLKGAYDAISALLEAADAERGGNVEVNKTNLEVENMEMEELKEMIKGAVKEVLEEQKEPEAEEAEEETKEEVEKEEESQEAEEETQEEAEKEEAEAEPTEAEKQIAALKKEVEKLKKGRSLSLHGQDGSAEKAEPQDIYDLTNRDANGCVIRK